MCRSSVIDVVTSSAAESELAATFMNAKEAAYIRNTLEALGYKQEKTTLVTDNAFVHSLVNGECKAKRSRAMDMRFYWLKTEFKENNLKSSGAKGIKTSQTT